MLRRLPVPSVVLAVLIGCLGKDPEPTAGSPNTSDSGTDGSSASPSNENDAEAGSVQAPDTGTPPKPNRSIGCDGVQTCTGSDNCCGVGTDWINASCKPDCGGAYMLTCDDAKDCGAGQVCCYKTDGGARAVASFCAASCRPEKNELQLCALNAPGECATGSCTPLTQFSPNGLSRCD